MGLSRIIIDRLVTRAQGGDYYHGLVSRLEVSCRFPNVVGIVEELSPMPTLGVTDCPVVLSP
jgi:hypothetical protein